MKTRKNQNGFTLVELMIVIAIVAILAAIALPPFKRQVGLTKRVEAFTALELIFHAEYATYVANDSYEYTYAKLGLDSYIASLKYYQSANKYPGGFTGCWISGLEICVFQSVPGPVWNGFIAALGGDIDGKNEGTAWINEDAVILGFGNVRPSFPDSMDLGVPQVYHDDFWN